MFGACTYSPETADRVFRVWVRDGRFVGFPAKRSRRLPLLDLAAQAFEPGESYSAHQVDEALTRWHPDTATLRRYLVEEGFLDRLPDGSRWWRCGGTVDLDPGVPTARPGGR
jgi:hypothetical protein